MRGLYFVSASALCFLQRQKKTETNTDLAQNLTWSLLQLFAFLYWYVNISFDQLVADKTMRYQTLFTTKFDVLIYKVLGSTNCDIHRTLQAFPITMFRQHFYINGWKLLNSKWSYCMIILRQQKHLTIVTRGRECRVWGPIMWAVVWLILWDTERWRKQASSIRLDLSFWFHQSNFPPSTYHFGASTTFRSSGAGLLYKLHSVFYSFRNSIRQYFLVLSTSEPPVCSYRFAFAPSHVLHHTCEQKQ